MAASWLDKLNPAQREAVTYGDGPLLVIAGAGTGKTGTLACRVAWLIEKGTPPDRILLLTFTRRAAAEMISRAGRLIGKAEGGAAGRVWGGTFHAVANRLLRMYGPAIGLPANFTVMDQGDAADMMNLIRSELGLARGRKRFPRKDTLVAIYSRTVNARDRLDHVLEVQFPWCQPDREGIAAIFDLYTQRKRERNVVDYDDLLLLWSALCRVPRIGDAVADRFDHILVDEYQDTNAIQAEILLGMRKNRRNIMVVGDDAQSIYSFRAATIRNILDFPSQFPGTRIVTLEQNYRSTQPILAASNAVMAGAKERYTKELRSDRASDQKPVLITCRDEAEQCAAVCDNVMKHLERGTPLRRQGVLFRAGHHSDQLEVELSRRKIPFHKYGGLKFIEAAHIKDMLAFLRILENPFDEVSWFRVLQLLDGVGPRSARRIMDLLGVRQGAAATVASPLKRFIEEPPPAPAAGKEQFDKLRNVLADCTGQGATGGVRPKRKAKGSGARAPAAPVAGDSAVSPLEDDTEPERANEPPLTAQVERIRLFYEPIFERLYENPAMRIRDIEQLQQIAGGYRSRSSFITALTLDPPTSTSDLAQPPYLEEDYLVLSTIHSAKGCEWDVVHIIHAADGMIPSDMAVSDAAGVDEERRLLYVAMTRAKDMLYVYFPLRYYHARFTMGDRHSYAQISRFLDGKVRRLFETRIAAGARDDDFPVAARSMQDVEKWLQGLWKK